MTRKTIGQKVAELKIREAKRLEDKARALRAKAIIIEAEAARIRAELKP
jgi:hypothetical protein